MDIGNSEENSPCRQKCVLVLMDKCLMNTFLYGIHGTSSADVVENLWFFLLMLVDSLAQFKFDFDAWFIDAKAICSFDHMIVTLERLHPIDKIKMVWLNIVGWY